MKKLKVAVIGLGDMGCSHARGFDHIPECQVVATVDPDVSWPERRPIDWKNGAPPHFANHLEMLEKINPDCCIIAVPDYLHREVACDCLTAGCDLLLEKPVATNLQDTDAILKCGEEMRKLIQIGLVYRYSNLYRKMAEIGHDPKHPVSYMWCKELRQCFPQKPWFFSQEKCGGTIVEKDCHHFDIFSWVINSKATRVFATGGQHVYKNDSVVDCNYCLDPPMKMDLIDTVDNAIVTVDYENGARAALMLCMYLQPGNVMFEGLEIGGICKSGRQLVAYSDERLMVGGAGEEFHNIKLDMYADNEMLGHIGVQTQRREFLECVREQKQPFADGQVGRESLLIALAAEESIRTGMPINLAEFDQ
jgi:predicted dehydrogenase